MSKIEDKMCEFGIQEMPREFLSKLIEIHPEMKIMEINDKPCSINDLTDDECRIVLRGIFNELANKGEFTVTISDYENEVIKVKEHQRKTKCARCLIMEDQYMDHMTKVLKMLKTSERVMQEAIIELDNPTPSMNNILMARSRLMEVLQERK